MPETATIPEPTATAPRRSTPHDSPPQPLTPEEWEALLHARLCAQGVESGKPIEWARHLATALECTYTGADKIVLVKNAIAARFDDPRHRKKEPTHPDRHLTADEAIHVLEQGVLDGACTELTVAKAKALREYGTYLPVGAPGHAADRLPAPPKTLAPERELPALVEPEVVAEASGGEVEVVGVKTIVQPPPKPASVDHVPEPPKAGGRVLSNASKLG